MSQLKLTIVGDPTPLRNATRKAEGSLRKLQKTTQSVGASMNKTFGALGLGIGLATLTNGLKNATKAASEDRKSQGLLANALKNTVGATSQAIAGAESYIKKTQLQTAVLDDELRPALATAVRATGSLAGGQRLLDTALDVSAGTGKDLSTVTNAMAKAFNGNTGALKKLLPSIKDGTDFMSQLQAQFAGSAEAAAKLDPYKRLEVIFADIQETVGEALLPALEEFSLYLASPAGQENVRTIVNLFVAMGTAIGRVISFLVQNINLVKTMIGILVTLKLGWMGVTAIVKLYEMGVISAATATKALKYALISTGIGAIAVAVGSLASAWLETAENTEDATDAAESYLNDPAIQAAIRQTNAWRDEVFENEQKRIQLAEDQTKSLADAIRKALDSKIEGIKKTAEKFRDAVGLAFGVFGDDEYSVFNPDYLIAKMKRILEASKGFAANLAKLRKSGADESLIGELTAMGPAQGNIVAKGLISSGKLGEILKLRGSLYGTGASVGAQQAVAGNATYEINISKATVSATDIIREIKLLEKKSGRKYLVN
jgi:hypothetical protein